MTGQAESRTGGAFSARWALWGGVLFSALFTALIWFPGPRLEAVPLLPDQGASWYFWQLPEPTVLTRATAWALYALHQLAFWALILYAQTRRRRRYAQPAQPVNVAALAINALFVGLHFLQTHVWYDGLAQDVSIFSSQGSVVLLLVWVLLMENQPPGPLLRPSGAPRAGGGALRPHLPRLPLRLGHRLHLLVPPDGRHPRAPGGLLLHVPAPAAGEPLLHPRPPQPLVDGLARGARPGPRRAGGLRRRERPVADVRLRLRRRLRGHPDARPGPPPGCPARC